MSERKFTRALGKPGMAAHLRETVSQVVRDTAIEQNKQDSVDPLDFESFIMKNKTLIHNDSHRELLLYPSDDILQVVLPREYREVIPNTLKTKLEDLNLLSRQCINSYFSDWSLIHYKYCAYSGSYLDLPGYNRQKKPEGNQWNEELYEVDTNIDEIDESILKSGITKEGYLLKGPEMGASDRMFSNIGSKSFFKRRYCHLRQQVDGTYILEFFKDQDKKGDVKIANLDFCTEIVRNTKRGKYCFDLKMSAGTHKSYTLAADNESDLQDWIITLNNVLQHYRQQEENQAAWLEKTNNITELPSSPSSQSVKTNQNQIYGTLKGLEQSMNPQLIRYSQETDISISSARKKNRKCLFPMYLHYQFEDNKNVTSVLEKYDHITPYKEQFHQRIFIKCEDIRFKLQVSKPADTEQEFNLYQVEPYYTTLSIFDARNNRKLSENFHFDVNHECVKSMMKDQNSTDNSLDYNSDSLDNLLKDIPIACLCRIKQAVFNISNPHPDIFLVIRIDKILQGNIYQTSEPYVRAAKDSRLGMKVHKQIQAYNQRLGNYRMPFAWSARPLFRLYSNELDTSSDFPAIYRQEGNKLKDEELLKLLQEYRKPEKLNKLTTIPGWIKIKIDAATEVLENCLSTTLAPLKTFANPTKSEITLEIAEFEGSSEKDVYPYTTYINNLYVYPQSLLFDAQKIFSRARNIACMVEMRDSDSENAQPLKCIYGRPGAASFISRISCPVLHHNATPCWYEEIKIKLPLKLECKHHLLFSFYHISCDINKKKENAVETCLGYAWLPLLTKGRHTFIEENTQILPVATHLPEGYLSIQPLGLGKGNAGPEIVWIDSQKPIFTVFIQMKSTIFTNDIHLDNLFIISEKIIDPMPVAIPSDSEICKILKSALDIQLVTIIRFLPTIFNQLFTLLIHHISDEVGNCILTLLIHIINIVNEAGRQEILLAYEKFIFTSSTNKSNNSHLSVHEQLVKYISILFLSKSDGNSLLLNKFMYHSGLFFDIIVKSMAQHLLVTGRIKMHRSERFTKEYQEKIDLLVQSIIPHIINEYKDIPIEICAINKSLAQFLKRCLSLMDRGLVFKLINYCVDKFPFGGSRTLNDFKFKFLQVICSHEHYISFNLPLVQSWMTSSKDALNNEYYLTYNFRKHHFLVGIILQQVKTSFNEAIHIRKMAITTLKDLLAKHELDDRYQDKGRLSRIAALYMPLLGIVLENLDRLLVCEINVKNEVRQNIINRTSNQIFSCATHIQDSNCSVVTAVKDEYNMNLSPNNTITPIKLPQSHNRYLSHNESQSSPIRSSMSIKDSAYLAAIAGHSSSMTNGYSATSIESDLSVSSNTQSNISQETTILNKNGELPIENNNHATAERKEYSHKRSVSQTAAATLLKCENFEVSEIQDLLICFSFIIKYLEDDQLMQWWQQCDELDIRKFLSILELSLHHFKYQGKKLSSIRNVIVQDHNDKPRTVKSMTLPARMTPPDFSNDSSAITGTLQPQNTATVAIRENILLNSDYEKQHIAARSNLAVEVGLVVLDSLGLFCFHFKDLLLDANGTNPVIHQVFNIYLTFLQIGQSENLYHHVFAALRSFMNNFSVILFQGNAALCGQLCYELLRCSNSKLSSIRQESCALLYLLMRSNFEFTNRKGLTRVHLQVMISISQMLGNVIGFVNNLRFQESLSLINSYACSDKVMKGTSFPVEVQDLNKRIRTVLMSTAQMREHNNDPEQLIDLEHSLANSYASTPELRHTWLETMSRNHIRDGNHSEAACCQLHISALMSEYLKLNKLIDWGAEFFDKISKNIPRDEKGLKLDYDAAASGIQDVLHYNEHILLEQLESCAEFIDKAERFELLGPLYNLIIPLYEKKRNYQALANCYSHLTRACNKVVQVTKSGKRLLGRFYKVAFYGSAYFDQENGVEYIYKEPKVTTLSEISERLLHLYSEKFGSENVKLILDSTNVEISKLDQKIAYIQVTYVVPYFDETELEVRLTEFERNHDISRFMFETPFTSVTTTNQTNNSVVQDSTCNSTKTRGHPREQWKRRTILTTQSSFPYVKKRIRIINKTTVELSPIQVALDEMRQRVQELQDVALITGSGGGGGPAAVDAKKLQLKLQGSICVTVNAGPLAYAHAFLDPASSSEFPDDLVQELKDVFREFVKICYTALQINSKLITCDQQEYQEALRENYQNFCQNLSTLLGESVWPDAHITSFKRNSAALFNAISGTTNSHSSTA